MIPTPDQRRDLGAFLRTHRERLAPAEVGVSGGSARRRTPGLRREEVAHLSGLSATWYTWLEQGRDVSVSAEALARIAAAMRLTPAERAYLFELALRRDPDAPDGLVRESAPPALLATLRAITAPAYLLDRLWTARGWNEAAQRHFTGWLGDPSGGTERNLLRYVFLDPTAQTFIADWRERAHRLLAEFRADSARRGDDPDVVALADSLRRESPLFARFWTDHGVLEREGGRRAFHHPTDGHVVYEQVTLSPDRRSGFKLVLLLPPETAPHPSPDP